MSLKFNSESSSALRQNTQNNDGENITPSIEGLDVGFARDYLETTANVGYYEGINHGTPESFVLAVSKLEPIKHFLPNPKNIISVGVGAGEEIQALAHLYEDVPVEIYGLDLSPRALLLAKDRLEKWGLTMNMIEGSAINLPLEDESVDGFVESAILHEIYSYVPDGKMAWETAITEISRTLSENGVYLLRDFAAPSSPNALVELVLSTEMAQQFYDYFREHFRTFVSWDQESAAEIMDRRSPSDGDYPEFDSVTKSVVLPLGKVSELVLHFRNFYDNFSKNLVTIGDSSWKEINESYLPLNPKLEVNEVMPIDEYVAVVLEVANSFLADSDYQIVCVQSDSSNRPDTAKFLSNHFSIQADDVNMSSIDLLNDMVRKMELVFMKVKR